MSDLTPGRYRNTNTGAEFDVELSDDEEEVIITDGEGDTRVEFTQDAGDFWFNTLDCTGPTYKLVEAADGAAEAEHNSETDSTSTTTA